MPVNPYTQVYDNYDKIFVNWVSTLTHEDRQILTVFSTPERALAQISKKLARKGAAGSPEVIPLPFASVSRTSEKFDQERFVNFTHRREYYNTERAGFVTFQRPSPYKFTYQVHFWVRNLSHLDRIRDQIIAGRTRAREFYLTIPHADPLGDLLVRFLLEDIQDVPPVDYGEEQRALRRVFVFTADGWICHPSTLLKRVEKVIMTVATSEDLETRDEVITQIEYPSESA